MIFKGILAGLSGEGYSAAANKQNVFDDFIGPSEWLINDQYTNPSKLAIFGGSNISLLVEAALTQRPDLYQVVVLWWHPLLDMLRYDLSVSAC